MRLAVLMMLAAFAALAQTASPAASKSATPLPGPTLNGQPVRIALGTFYQMERDFDARLDKIGEPNTPIDLLGATRGVYLDGYGAVFTSEISLVRAPSLSPFHQTITKEEIAQVHQRKLDRLPALRDSLKQMVQSAARSLFLIPENQQIVVAVRLDYLQWENTAGMPGLILMRADRKSALAGDIHHEEQ
jgi:hypothetical protein